MIRSIFILVILLSTIHLFGQNTNSQKNELKIGNADYTLADYSLEYSHQTVRKLHILKKHFKKCFCESTDSVFLKSLDTGSCYFDIEPLLINLTSCDGLYSYRSFGKHNHVSARFLNGFPHNVFLVSQSHVYYLNRMYSHDTTAPDKLIEKETAHLLTLLQSDDIKIIKTLANQYTFWSNYITEFPFHIYNGKELYFNDLEK